MGRKKRALSEDLHPTKIYHHAAQRRLLQKALKGAGNTGRELHNQNLSSSSSIAELFSENHFWILGPAEF